MRYLISLLVLVSCAACPPTKPTNRPVALGSDRPIGPISEPSMRVHFIDVGQADATLLEFPCAAVLVDTGAEENELFNGTEALTNYLDRFFTRRSDLHQTLALLVITHAHADHVHGIPAILKRYAVKNVVTNGNETSSGGELQAQLHRWVGKRQAAGEQLGYQVVRAEDVVPERGLTDPVIDPVDCPEAGVDPRITALWGSVHKNPGWPPEIFEDENNHSIVLRVDFGRSSFLLTADLEDEAIDTLVRRHGETRYSILDVDVYRVGHHGSHNGTSRELIKAMTPDMAVISMGPVDRELEWTAWAYGHPRRKAVQVLLDGVSMHRVKPIRAMVGESIQDFEELLIEKAVYATGWEGTIVVTADKRGRYTVGARIH